MNQNTMQGTQKTDGRVTLYAVTAKITDGKRIIGFKVVRNKDNKQLNITRETAAYLVGKGVVVNMTGAISEGKLVFRSKEVKSEKYHYDKLPTYNIKSKEWKNVGELTPERRGLGVEDRLSMATCIGRVMDSKSKNVVLGYVIEGANGAFKGAVTKAFFNHMVKDNKISNVKLFKDGDRYQIRVVSGAKILEMPKCHVNQINWLNFPGNEKPQDGVTKPKSAETKQPTGKQQATKQAADKQPQQKQKVQVSEKLNSLGSAKSLEDALGD